MSKNKTAGEKCKRFLHDLMLTAPPKWQEFLKEQRLTINYEVEEHVRMPYLSFLDNKEPLLESTEKGISLEYTFLWNKRGRGKQVDSGARNSSMKNLINHTYDPVSKDVANAILYHYQAPVSFSDFEGVHFTST